MTPRDNLPAAVPSFIGRRQERKELGDVLSHQRLVTLTGVGGCGKTQLALRVAADLAPCFEDGVRFVDLAPVMDSAQVARAVAAAVGVGGRSDQSVVEALRTSLARRQLLLLLDNCEHLIEGCAQLTEVLLQGCPRLSILATSREPLRVPGEVIRRVSPLMVPEPGPLTVQAIEGLAEVESVSLFVDRARTRQPDFHLASDNASTVIEICRRLEGLPLAIELAAAQISVLTLDQIASQLDRALTLPTRGSRTLARQATLRSTLAWSYALLSPEERLVFRRLAVFAGSFDAHAAERVCGDGGQGSSGLLSVVSALIDKSLLESRVHGHRARYRLLEPVRQYAWEHLVRHGEAASLQRRHAEYFVELVEGAEPELRSAHRHAAMQRLDANLDNLRAALAGSKRNTNPGDVELGLRLASALFWFWNFRGDVSEGLEWLQALLAVDGHIATAVRADALHAAGELSWLLGDDGSARAYLEESVALCRATAYHHCLAYDLQALTMLLEPTAARAAASESLSLFNELSDRWGAAHASLGLQLLQAENGDLEQPVLAGLAEWRRLNDGWGVAQVLNMLGDQARSRGEDALARSRYEEALTLLRQVGITGTVPSLLHNLGYLALHAGNLRQALDLFQQSLTLFRDQGDRRGIADCLEGVASVLAAPQQQPKAAARLFGAAEALREALNVSAWPANASDVARAKARVRAHLDAATSSSAWASGRVLSIELAIAEALAVEVSSDTRTAGSREALTAREREVAVLVARGLTNRQIGAALVITEGTARLHVKHILQKLDFRSRSRIAAWAVVRGIVPKTVQDIHPPD